jgi:hypothetical protein
MVTLATFLGVCMVRFSRAKSVAGAIAAGVLLSGFAAVPASAAPAPAKGCYVHVTRAWSKNTFTIKGHNMSGALKATFKGRHMVPGGASKSFELKNVGIPHKSSIRGTVLVADGWINGFKCRQHVEESV